MKSVSPGMGAHARRQAILLLEQTAAAMKAAAKKKEPKQVHDLRLSVRRFSQCLNVFGQFYHHKRAQKIRHQLKDIMDHAAEARDRDIALAILRRAGLRSSDELVRKLSEERETARKELSATLDRDMRHNFPKRWRRAFEP